MEKINTTIKEKPILATLLIAVIIGLICLIIFTLRYYEPEIKNAPNVTIKVEDMGENLRLEPVAYDWFYKGKQDRHEIEFDPNKYDYSNCTIYKSYWGYDPMMRAESKYSFKDITKTTYMFNPDKGEYEYYETENNSIKQDEYYVGLRSSSGVSHNYVTIYTVTYGSQGTASYVVKVVEEDDYHLGIIKEYKGINLEQSDRIKELLSKLSYGIYFQGLQIEENKINITYKYRIGKDGANTISIALFSLIDNLEEITFSHQNKDFVKWDNMETKPIEYTEPRVMSKEEFSQNLNIDWNNMKDTFGL